QANWNSKGDGSRNVAEELKPLILSPLYAPHESGNRQEKWTIQSDVETQKPLRQLRSRQQQRQHFV
ncbi:MAG: hypothetical protein ACRDAM_01755, partial [Casimicrobium sp.]